MEPPSGPPPTIILDPMAPRSRPPAALVVWIIAIVGSVGGIGAAILNNSALAIDPMVGILVFVVAGPAVEEICKPLAIVFLLDKRPHWFRGSTEIVILAACSALVFATLENLLYIFVHNPGGSESFVFYRLTVCTALHVKASTVFGLGLAKMWRHIRDKGGHFDIDICFKYYVTAVIIHGVYNGSALILEWSGVLNFK
jgi:RsiW-degrading membrane proteinase PrsW (M82 family)